MKKTMSLFAATAMAASTMFALPRKAVDMTVSGYTGASTLANFPVLVRISPERISGFSYADCAADGADIAFEDAQGNALDHEIDTWRPFARSSCSAPSTTRSSTSSRTSAMPGSIRVSGWRDAASILTRRPLCATIMV